MDKILLSIDKGLVKFKFETKTYYGVYMVGRTTLQQMIKSFLNEYKIDNHILQTKHFVLNGKSIQLEKKVFPLENKLEIKINDIGIETTNPNELKFIKEKVSEGKPINIFIKEMNGRTSVIKILPDMSIYELKVLLEEKTGVPICQQRLIFAGKQLDNEGTLLYYNIRFECTIHMVLRLRGGMYRESSGKNGTFKELESNIFIIDPDIEEEPSGSDEKPSGSDP